MYFFKDILQELTSITKFNLFILLPFCCLKYQFYFLLMEYQNSKDYIRKSMSITQVSYIKTAPNIFKPINIKPTNQIKCSYCNNYFPYDQLQAHSLTHIPSKYSEQILNKKYRQGNNINKLDFQNLLKIQQNHQDISVKSFLPDQMPAAQNVRKKAFQKQEGLILDAYDYTSQGQINFDKVKYTQMYKMQKYLSKNHEVLKNNQIAIQQIEAPETFKQLSFKQKVDLKPYTIDLPKQKNLHVYMNQKQNKPGGYFDKLTIKQKNPILQKQEQQNKQNFRSYLVQKRPIQKKNTQKITMQINLNRKPPVCKQNINTLSTTSTGFFKHNQDNFYKTCNSNTNTRQKFFNSTGNKFECPQCKGFYCNTCKSDIPPIYRPVPNENHDRSFQIDQQTQKFYANRVLNKSNCGKTSRVTKCTNCQ